ncbi:glutathione S-transferase C-terminal domain-containing protein [Streptacidiphilus sp. ASG 303]|uniref:glutathione S-transferase C-terminal domain-containing protein n=1 Tax=Streptacidiphilus sp. ASG 303 TaxID=2896847 RepID=UPI001E342196|nr:glutathione S-transferase C-terminal domain-containing protein [Streptacidiphilus sp. ASG 303]MCD0485511.1 glutathione S-transferase C-terminal domain-containing protein [Streptacidiphilus sp. ASG 303]
MSETAPRTTAGHALRPRPDRLPQLSGAEGPVQRFRGRIGSDARSGYYPALHRYHLYLSLACPLSLRTAVTLSLAGLEGQVSVTVLDPVAEDLDAPAAPGGRARDGAAQGLRDLRRAYEASRHRYDGPVTVPALCDRWSGRLVSNHAPDIMRDLATRLPGGPAADATGLYPPHADADLEELALLLDEGIGEAAQRAGRAPAGRRDGEALRTILSSLAALEHRLTDRHFVAGPHLTAADVHLWATLVQLDLVHRLHLDEDAVRRIADHPRLWAHARRLHLLPAFHRTLRPDHIARRHRRSCRGPESSGARLPLADWTIPPQADPGA